jgi:hypothetical protein
MKPAVTVLVAVRLVILFVVLLAATAAPVHAQWSATAYVDNNAVGDVQSGRIGAGLSAGYYFHGRLGLELDGELHGHFFRDEKVAALMPDGVDLNTRAAIGSGNIVVPYCLHSPATGTWCPYVTTGFGIIEEILQGIAHAPGASSFDRTQIDPAVNAGIGAMHALTPWLGLRVDARYFHAFIDEASTTGYATDYGYWRVSVGLTFGGP